MTICKITSSGKGFLVIHDDGTPFVSSVEFIKGLIDGRSPKGFVLMSRLPNKVHDSRFLPSPLFGSEEPSAPPSGTVDDSLSASALKERHEKSLLSDKVVW